MTGLETSAQTAVRAPVDAAELEWILESGAAMRPVRAAPIVRRRARECGLDLTVVPGTGPGGRVLLSDLDAPHVVPARRTPPENPGRPVVLASPRARHLAAAAGLDLAAVAGTGPDGRVTCADVERGLR